MNIRHEQKTYIYCCKCKTDILVSNVTVPDGAEFLKCTPADYNWKSFILNDQIHYLCPKHDLTTSILTSLGWF